MDEKKFPAMGPIVAGTLCNVVVEMEGQLFPIITVLPNDGIVRTSNAVDDTDAREFSANVVKKTVAIASSAEIFAFPKV